MLALQLWIKYSNPTSVPRASWQPPLPRVLLLNLQQVQHYNGLDIPQLFQGRTVKKSNGIVSEPSSAASDESDISNAQQTLQPLVRYMVAALLLGPILTLLALRPVLTHAPVNVMGPVAIFMVGLAAWYLISVRRINAAVKLVTAGIWIAVTGIAFFTGALQSPVMVVYPVIILLTGWLVSVRYAKWMTGITAARFGGDEFVVLIPELGQAQDEATRQALGIAEKIRKVWSRPYVLDRHTVDGVSASITHPCTVSIGVLVFSAEQAPTDVLLKWADAAMYQAKDEGRNRVHLFQEMPA